MGMNINYEILEKQFQYYLEHQDEFVSQYSGKAIVLRGNEVVGVYDNEWEAVKQSQRKYKPGTFLVQVVSPGSDAYSVDIASNFVVVS